MSKYRTRRIIWTERERAQILGAAAGFAAAYRDGPFATYFRAAMRAALPRQRWRDAGIAPHSRHMQWFVSATGWGGSSPAGEKAPIGVADAPEDASSPECVVEEPATIPDVPAACIPEDPSEACGDERPSPAPLRLSDVPAGELAVELLGRLTRPSQVPGAAVDLTGVIDRLSVVERQTGLVMDAVGVLLTQMGVPLPWEPAVDAIATRPAAPVPSVVAVEAAIAATGLEPAVEPPIEPGDEPATDGPPEPAGELIATVLYPAPGDYAAAAGPTTTLEFAVAGSSRREPRLPRVMVVGVLPKHQRRIAMGATRARVTFPAKGNPAVKDFRGCDHVVVGRMAKHSTISAATSALGRERVHLIQSTSVGVVVAKVNEVAGEHVAVACV